MSRDTLLFKQMIRTFRQRSLKRFFEVGRSKGVPQEMGERIRRQLDQLDAASGPGGMKVPGWELHELKGNRKGTWSIRVTANFRITFRFKNGDAYEVDLEDYH